MKNWIITGDVHIHDYVEYSSSSYSRLNKFIELAHRFVEMGKENDAKTFVIAGDLVHRAVVQPHVLNVVNEFMLILSKGFDKVYYIKGNHDVASKALNPDIHDTVLPAISNGAEYMHGKVLTGSGKSIGFLDWAPEIQFDLLPNKVDLLISHITISSMFGQTIDHSKFGLCISGDIHNITNEGNAHSICPPIPSYISDDQTGYVVLLDSESLDWFRVETESDSFKFMRIFYSDEIPDKYKDSEFLVSRERQVVSVDGDTLEYGSLDLNKVIEEVVTHSDLNTYHADILSSLCDSTDSDRLNLNFNLNYITLNNFRSIEHLEYNFNQGTTLVVGENGKGKSSLMRSIEYALCGSSTTRSLVKRGTEGMDVRLSLSYQGREIIITRGHNSGGSLEIEIDGDPINAGSIKDKQSKLVECLPFIKYFDIMYRKQGDPGILNGYNYSARIELVSNILGLGLIKKLHSVGKSKWSELQREFDSVTESIKLKSASTEALYSDEFNSIVNPSVLTSELNELIRKLSQVGNELSLWSDYNKVKAEHNSSKLHLESIIYNKELASSDISSIHTDIEEGKMILSGVRDSLSISKSKVDSLASEKLSILSSKSVLEKELSAVLEECPSCERAFDEESLNSTKENLQIKIDSLSDKLSRLDLSLESANKKYHEQRVESEATINGINKVLESLHHKKGSIESEKMLVSLYNNSKDKFDVIHNRLELTPKPNTSIDELSSIRTSLLSEITRIKCKETLNNSLISRKQDYTKSVESVLQLELDLGDISPKVDQASKYMKLFSPTGSVVRSVFQEVSKMMTSKDVVVRTIKELASGDERIDFDIDMRVGNLVLPYSDLSGGQQTYCDMFFLLKLFEMSGKVGCLVLDETLKFLDDNTLDKVSRLLKSSPINMVMISTHVDSFPYYDSRINAVMSGNNSEYHCEGGG